MNRHKGKFSGLQLDYPHCSSNKVKKAQHIFLSLPKANFNIQMII